MNTKNQVPRRIWRDGEFVDWADATVHVLSQSLQRGSLAFDYLGIHSARGGQAVFRLADHVKRLLNTCAISGLPISWSEAELIDAVLATVRENPGARSVRISALIPSVEVGIVPQDPFVSVFIAAYDSRADIIDRNAGEYHHAPLLALKVERNKRGRRDDLIPPQAKVAASYTPSIPAKWQAMREGFDDIVLLDESDHVTEAPTANLFLVTAEGALATAPTDRVLKGITRASIIDIARSLGIVCEERDIEVDELLGAAEVFLTGTSVGVWPVIRVDQHVIGNGAIGPVSERLQSVFHAVVKGEVAEFEHWLYYA